MKALGLLAVLLYVACGGSSQTAIPTPTPIPWYTPEQITQIYKSNPATGMVRFERHAYLYIRGEVAEIHESEPGLIYLVKRPTGIHVPGLPWFFKTDDWRVLRADLPVEQAGSLALGDTMQLRCLGLTQHNVTRGKELSCESASLFKELPPTPVPTATPTPRPTPTPTASVTFIARPTPTRPASVTVSPTPVPSPMP